MKFVLSPLLIMLVCFAGKVTAQKDTTFLIIDVGSEFNVHPPVKQGQGVVFMKSLYRDGERDGIWKKWTADWHITDSIVYDKGDILAKAQYKYHENYTLWRYSLEWPPTNIKMTREFDTANVRLSQARVSGNDGEIFTYYPGGQTKSHSSYKNGKRILNEQFDENGNEKKD